MEASPPQRDLKEFKLKGIIVKKLLTVLVVVILMSGCTSNRFIHKTFEGESLLSHTEVNYNSLGGKEIQDIYGMKTPDGHWEFGLGVSNQQEIEVETVTSTIVRILEERGLLE